MNTDIFKAYDIRGKVGEELTPNVALRVGRAMADWLPTEGLVAVGRDMRPDSKDLALALIDGLVQQGRDIIDIGEVTSDMAYFAAGKYKLAGAAMITASHNPGEYNGIKLCREEVKPLGLESGLSEIRDLALDDKFKVASVQGKTIQKDIIEDWIEHVLSFIDVNKLRPLKIVVDAGNGMAGKIFPELEPYVPFEVDEMYFDLDGTFPNHIANPVDPKNLIDIIKKIKNGKYDAGVAFDGDGDRAVLIDEKGQVISGTVLSAILAKYILNKRPGSTILYNANCGNIVPETIAKFGGKAVRTKVGHSYIKADMRTHNAELACESSGHYYFKDNFKADSGLIAAVIALYVLSIEDKTLSNLANEFKIYKEIPETNFVVTNKEQIMKQVEKLFINEKIDWLDGLTVRCKDYWFNIRPSNTEPLLRLNIEAKTENKLREVSEQLTKIISGNK